MGGEPSHGNGRFFFGFLAPPLLFFIIYALPSPPLPSFKSWSRSWWCGWTTLTVRRSSSTSTRSTTLSTLPSALAAPTGPLGKKATLETGRRGGSSSTAFEVQPPQVCHPEHAQFNRMSLRLPPRAHALFSGKSRSAASLVQYLMQAQGRTLADAMRLVKEARPVVSLRGYAGHRPGPSSVRKASCKTEMVQTQGRLKKSNHTYARDEDTEKAGSLMPLMPLLTSPPPPFYVVAVRWTST